MPLVVGSRHRGIYLLRDCICFKATIVYNIIIRLFKDAIVFISSRIRGSTMTSMPEPDTKRIVCYACRLKTLMAK